MLKKIFSYGIVEGVTKGLNKLILLLIPIFISTEDFGKLGLIVSIETLIPLVSFLGFDRAIIRLYNEKVKFPGFLSSILKPIRLFHLIFLLLTAFFIFIGFSNIFGIKLYPDILLLILLVYLQGLNLLYFNILRVEEKHNLYFKGRLLLQILKILFVLGLLVISKNYLAYLVGSILSALITNQIFKSKISRTENNSFNSKTLKSIFSFSWPFVFHGVALNLLGNVDKFIIERYMSLKAVGLYTFAYSIGSMISFAYIGISVYLEPIIYKEDDNEKRRILLDKFNFYALISGLLAYSILTILSIYVLPQIYGDSFNSVYGFIPMIALCYLIYPFYLSSNYRMIYSKNSKLIAIVSSISCLINISLNIWLVPIYGLYSAVLVTIISFIFQALGFILISNKFKYSSDFVKALILSCYLALSIAYNFNLLYNFAFMFLYIFVFHRKFILTKAKV